MTKKYEQKLESYLGVKANPGPHEKRLWKKLKKYQKIFSYIPGVVCICVCNSLSMNACHKDSDIDLFIITKNKRLWTARIMITCIMALLGERKTGKNHAEKFCLSFFISENAMDFEKIAIENDIYLAYWTRSLVPVVNKDHTFEKFMEMNKKFISKQAPLGVLSDQEGGNLNTANSISSPSRRGLGGGICGDYFESLLKRIFLPRTQKRFQKLGKPYGVIISDDMLKFHNNDKRKEIRDAIFS